jgi:hypothetical protein
MAIEPIGKVVPDRENKQFGAITNTKCDRRVNFRGIWGHARQVSDQLWSGIEKRVIPGIRAV